MLVERGDAVWIVDWVREEAFVSVSLTLGNVNDCDQYLRFFSPSSLSFCFSLVKSGRSSSSSSSGSVPFELTSGSIPTAMLMVKYARCDLSSFLCLTAPAPVLSH